MLFSSSGVSSTGRALLGLANDLTASREAETIASGLAKAKDHL